MDTSMQVSVVIPVYNAADFVQEAVGSALAQPETAEVILAEDGSTDDSLAVCQMLAEKYSQVHLYRHADGGNHGSGATRNLAIERSTCPYVAFLDADDFFLPGRFTCARELFEEHPDIDGVYEAIGTHFQDEAARQQWRASGMETYGPDLTTMVEVVPPERLFEALVRGKQGYFSGDGLVVRRAVFEKSGLFDERLLFFQDTEMWLRMAATARLVPGRLDRPVAMRRVHAHNRLAARQSPAVRRTYFVMMWRILWQWSVQNLDAGRQEIVFKAFLKELLRHYRDDPGGLRRARTVARLMVLPLKHPRLLRTSYFWRQCLVRFLWGVGLSSLLPYFSGSRWRVVLKRRSG